MASSQSSSETLPFTDQHRFIEATVPIIVSSMPSTAKLWKLHIVHTSIYLFLRSKLGKAASEDAKSSDMPSDLKRAKAEASKKKRREPFSLPSFFGTGLSKTRGSHKTEAMGIDTSWVDLERRIEGPQRFSLHLNNSSGYSEQTGATQVQS